jgi:hypothetical protein
MVRRILALGLLCGSLAFAQSANAQGLWMSGIGFGSPGFYGDYAPARFGYPVAVRPVYVARPVVSSGLTPVYRARPVAEKMQREGDFCRRRPIRVSGADKEMTGHDRLKPVLLSGLGLAALDLHGGEIVPVIE